MADHDDDLDESKSCKIYENLYKVCSSIVHPYDSDYAEFLNVLFDKRHTQGNFQGCCEILRLILKSHHQNLPKYYSQIGITEMVLARNCKQTADQQSCVKEKVNLLEEGERTYCVSIFQKYQFYCWIWNLDASFPMANESEIVLSILSIKLAKVGNTSQRW